MSLRHFETLENVTTHHDEERDDQKENKSNECECSGTVVDKISSVISAKRQKRFDGHRNVEWRDVVDFI